MARYGRLTDALPLAEGMHATGAPRVGGRMTLDRPDGTRAVYVRGEDGPELVADSDTENR